MAALTINDAIITSPAAEAYFDRADSRVRVGFRAALEMLGVPVPEYAKRKPPGRPPARAVAAAYEADHGKTPNYALAARKPNASPQAVAKAKARSA